MTDKINRTIKYQLIIIVLCAFIVNLNILFNGFVYDDSFQVVNNQWITSLRFIPDIFTHDVFNSENGLPSNYYRPIMYIIYIINSFIYSGLKPWGFHLTNILLHICISVAVFLLSSRLYKNKGTEPDTRLISAPLVAALIFAVHPIHTEVVAWVACIPELSFTLFSLLSLLFYIKSNGNFDRWFSVSLLSFAIAMFSKETSVTLLPIIVIFDSIFRSHKLQLRPQFVRYASFCLIILFYFICRLKALGGIAPGSPGHEELNTFELIINVFPLFGKYIEKLIVPLNMNVYYSLQPVKSIMDPSCLFSILILIAYLLACYLAYKKNKAVFFGLIIIVIPLLPVLYIRGIGDNLFADRYLYFPSVGFSIVIGSLSQMISQSDNRKTISNVIIIALLFVYSWGTFTRNKIWHDNVSLWTDTIKKSPDAYIPQLSLGMLYYEKGDLANAEKYLSSASSKQYVELKALIALAGIYAETDRQHSAIEILLKADKIHSDNPQILMMLSNLYKTVGDSDKSKQYHEHAKAMLPEIDEIIIQRVTSLCQDGEKLMAENNIKAAGIRYKEALFTKSDFVPALIDMGAFYATVGSYDKAFTYFAKANELEPNNPSVHYNMYLVYKIQGKNDAATLEMNKYLSDKPK